MTNSQMPNCIGRLDSCQCPQGRALLRNLVFFFMMKTSNGQVLIEAWSCMKHEKRAKEIKYCTVHPPSPLLSFMRQNRNLQKTEGEKECEDNKYILHFLPPHFLPHHPPLTLNYFKYLAIYNEIRVSMKNVKTGKIKQVYGTYKKR